MKKFLIAGLLGLLAAVPAWAQSLTGNEVVSTTRNGAFAPYSLNTIQSWVSSQIAGSNIAFSGKPTSTTAAAGDTTNQIATNAFVMNTLAQNQITIFQPITASSPVSYPIQYMQVFGPNTAAGQQALQGKVGAMWSSGYTPQPGVFTMSYAPAYRLYFIPTGWTGATDANSNTYAATQLGWLYYNHPDWIMYGSDGLVMYEFSNTNYPVVDISNPAAEAYMFQLMLANSYGYQALALDNVSTRNATNTDANGSVYQAGHYANPTIVPCPAASQPSCGGTWVQQYSSATDSKWTPVNLAYLKYLSSQAKAYGLATVANLGYQGGTDFVAAANAVSGVIVEDVPQHIGSTTANDWYNGFLIDTLFQDNLYNAENVSQKFYGSLSYLNGHDTSAITQAEESYATAWFLLTTQNSQNYLYAGQQSSTALEPYPPSMGGYVNVASSGTLSTSSTTITGIPSTTGWVAGLKISGAGLLDGTYIVTIPSSTSVTISTTPYAAGTAVPLNVRGFPALPLGTPLTPPPQVNPYATPPTGVCGWVNGANAGACSRQFSNGWAYINPVCQYNGTSCSVASNTVTIPTLTSGSWYDQFCHVVPQGPYTLNAASALVIALGTTSVCPWPQP